MTCLGKIIGGGMPLAAYGGKRAIMEKIAPLGPVYQAGTLSGNPVAVERRPRDARAPRRRALRRSSRALGARLEAGLVEGARRTRASTACVQRVGSMITLFFTQGPGEDAWTDAMTSRHQALRPLARRDARARRQYWPPSQFEAAFISGAHTEADIDATIAACAEALTEDKA